MQFLIINKIFVMEVFQHRRSPLTGKNSRSAVVSGGGSGNNPLTHSPHQQHRIVAHKLAPMEKLLMPTIMITITATTVTTTTMTAATGVGVGLHGRASKSLFPH
jgi:hypothetical protein